MLGVLTQKMEEKKSMKDVAFYNTNITGGFWKMMQEKNRTVTMDAVYNRFDDTGRIKAFNFEWKEGMDQRPHIFWDSDVAKWMEGAAYVLAKHPDAELERKVESLIDNIIKNQWEDGYFNIYYTVVQPESRFTDRNRHELYCAGHLMEAAVAYYQATGRDRFLKAMEKYADLIYRIFVEEQSAGFVTPGHEEIELALIRMYRCTKNSKLLELAKFFLNQRGNNPDKDVWEYCGISKYSQSNAPIRELVDAEGHSVRAMYLYAAMADLAKETDDVQLLEACRRLFVDTVDRKMYITGGIGSTSIGEAFTVPYDLPPKSAYTETCAAIGLIFFSQRMLEIEHKSVYADVIERVMYNGMISGISLDGKAFFYENPLEISLRDHVKNTSTDKKERYPITQRKEVFGCSCCPPNINRVFSSMERYVYHCNGDAVYVDQFMESEWQLEGRRISQKTAYPQNGVIALDFEGVSKAAIRIPAWCDAFTLNVPYTVSDGYAWVDDPSHVELCLDMKAECYTAHQEVDDCAGKVAVMMGPVVYCAERVDNPYNLHRLFLAKDLRAETTFCSACGLNKLTVDGWLRSASSALYAKNGDSFAPIRITLIPYYAFANRGESDMSVWLHQR